MQPDWQPILDFWFYPTDHPDYLRERVAWFEKNPDFDETIRSRFGGLVDEAVSGKFTEWDATPHGGLARILLLDQFTRNIWRDTPRAFSGDALALQAASRLIDAGTEKSLHHLERQFVYMPLMHAESLPTQERCVALFKALAADYPEHATTLDYAVRHRDIIARFGRFPHRNRQLGRESTAEELAFLKLPGSAF